MEQHRSHLSQTVQHFCNRLKNLTWFSWILICPGCREWKQPRCCVREIVTQHSFSYPPTNILCLNPSAICRFVSSANRCIRKKYRKHCKAGLRSKAIKSKASHSGLEREMQIHIFMSYMQIRYVEFHFSSFIFVYCFSYSFWIVLLSEITSHFVFSIRDWNLSSGGSSQSLILE